MRIEIGLAPPYELSSDGQRLHEELEDAIGIHNAQWDQFAVAAESLNAVGVMDWCPRREQDAVKLRLRRAELLRNEHELRSRIADFLNDVATTELPQASAVADQEYAAAQADIHNRLVEIGYVDDEYRRVLPSLVARHPRVKTARMKSEAFSGHTSHLAAIERNNQALKVCRDNLKRFKAGSLANLA